MPRTGNRVLFCSTRADEVDTFVRTTQTRGANIELVTPDSGTDVDSLLASAEFDVVVVDASFAGGRLLEHLFLWQYPFICIVDQGRYDVAETHVKGAGSDFVVRDADGAYIESLHIRVRNILNQKEGSERQNSQIQVSEQRFRDLVDALPDIVYKLDSDGCFTFVNESVTTLGWTPAQLIGRHFSTILAPEMVGEVDRNIVLDRFKGIVTGDECAPKLFNERRTGARRTRDLEVALLHRNTAGGAEPGVYTVTSWGEVSAVGIARGVSTLDGYGTVGVIRDITESRRNVTALRQALKEKELLLREMHHRIKNNLQVISSLLSLQGRSLVDETTKEMFRASQARVQAMAMIHEQLFSSSTNFSCINMARYIADLCRQLATILDVAPTRARLALEVDETIAFEVGTATSVGLLINELVSNSLKHAFLNTPEGTIRVSLSVLAADRFVLVVSDDGVGLPADYTVHDDAALGHTLVQTLAEQIDGTVTFVGSDGTTVRVEFSAQGDSCYSGDDSSL